MKKAIICFISAFLILSLAACGSGGKQGASQEMTLDFNFGERAGRYLGELDEDGLPDGYGSFWAENTSGDKWIYSGEWKHGHFDGQGMTKWESGEYYCGSYVDDKMNGYGILCMEDGNIVSGNFVDEVINGYSAVYVGDDLVFWGNYQDGDANDGSVYLSDGSVFKATHKNGNISYNPEKIDIAPPSEPIPSVDIDLPEETEKQEPAQDAKTPTVTTGMRNALRSAETYLAVMPFSYSGLIKQLEYEQYSHEEAVYAADNCGADWDEQAKKAAKNYLDLMGFSRSGLIEQLEYDGYTHNQAVYGADQNGL